MNLCPQYLLVAAVLRRSSSNLSGLTSAVNASKAQAVATNMMYTKAADIDIQNLYASLFNTTLQAQTCCGWSYNTVYWRPADSLALKTNMLIWKINNMLIWKTNNMLIWPLNVDCFSPWSIRFTFESKILQSKFFLFSASLLSLLYSSIFHV